MLKQMHRYGRRFKGELFFMLANYTTPIVGFVASFIATRFLKPEEMGEIQSVMLFIPYLSMLHLGAFTGLNRNLAYYLGKGDNEKAVRSVRASAFVAKANAWIGFLFGTGLFIFNSLRSESNDITMLASLAVLVLLVCTPHVIHISATYRSGQHFKQFARVTWISNISRLFYAFLPAFIGWLGYVISLSLQPIIKLVLLVKKQPYSAKGVFKRVDLEDLIKVGFPIMVYSYFSSLLEVADKSLVALYMSKEELGYFALTKLVSGTIMIIPASLSIILTPKVSACFGRTQDPHSLRKYFWIIFGLHILFIVPICTIGYFAVGPVVELFLPRYAPGIRVAEITMLTSLRYVVWGLLITTATIRKNLLPIVMFFLALAGMWLGGVILFKYMHPSIEMIAWLRFYVSMALAVGIFIYTYIETGQKRKAGDVDDQVNF